MTILMNLLFYIVLGSLLAWPGWLVARRVRHAHRPLRCVQPYRPDLAPPRVPAPPPTDR
jgi:hypothetical protein